MSASSKITSKISSKLSNSKAPSKASDDGFGKSGSKASDKASSKESTKLPAKKICDCCELYLIEHNSNTSEPSSDPEQEIEIFSKISTITSDGSHSSTKTDWISPSDNLIGLVDLQPPFTSKYIKGKTQEGIFNIAQTMIDAERARDEERIKKEVKTNDAYWKVILDLELNRIRKKAAQITKSDYEKKVPIMEKILSDFYEKSLRDLESFMRDELNRVMRLTQGEIITEMNIQIKRMMEIEKAKEEHRLRKIYIIKTARVRNYYKLLIREEKMRNQKLLREALQDRHDTIAALYTQMNLKNTSGTMYVMCSRRNQYIIRKIHLKEYYSRKEEEQLLRLKDKDTLAQIIKQKNDELEILNAQWQARICQILRLFLKFISYSLQLLPEQASFLLNFEKLVTLQLSEMKKTPGSLHPILQDLDEMEEEFAEEFVSDQYAEDNVIGFFPKCKEQKVCEKPFVLRGDFRKPPVPVYGSTDTLPLNVPLPYMILCRKYLYVKCQNFNDLEHIWQCKCEGLRPHCLCFDRPELIEICSACKGFKVLCNYEYCRRNLSPLVYSYTRICEQSTIGSNEENYEQEEEYVIAQKEQVIVPASSELKHESTVSSSALHGADLSDILSGSSSGLLLEKPEICVLEKCPFRLCSKPDDEVDVIRYAEYDINVYRELMIKRDKELPELDILREACKFYEVPTEVSLFSTIHAKAISIGVQCTSCSLGKLCSQTNFKYLRHLFNKPCRTMVRLDVMSQNLRKLSTIKSEYLLK